MSPRRNAVELRPVDRPSLLAHDHPARTVSACVRALDPSPPYARIEGTPHRVRASIALPGLDFDFDLTSHLSCLILYRTNVRFS